MTTATINVDVDIDVDLDVFSDDDLIAEMKSRGLDATGEEFDEDHPMLAIRDAFKLGRDALALELTRAMVCDRMGVIL